MRIVVKNDGHKNIVLRIPTGFLTGNLSALLVCRILRKKGVYIPFRHMRFLMNAINKYRRRHKDWNLVEINSSDGDYIQVKI
ncbi:MAG: hypothetical protein E7633_08445 [Ruminococcaceae bacterium]|nr:hypothetical protein [Oscillospiraceae bacterium]